MNGCMSLLSLAWEWSNNAMTLAIEAGLWAGLLAAVVLFMNVLFRRWLSARQMGLLWGIVLVRLLLPIAPPSSFSLQNFLSSDGIENTEHSSVAYSQPFVSTRAAASYAGFAPESARPARRLSSAFDLFFAMLPIIWLIGGIVYLAWTMVAHVRFCRRLHFVAAREDQRLRTLWEECCKLAAAPWSIPILLSDGIGQPAILGLFRPRLLLPTTATELSDQQTRMVMLHELAHVRRWHIGTNWALLVIRAVHWWNPVYWLAAMRFQSLREQSCDAFAIRRIEGQPIRDYSELLLALAQRPQTTRLWRTIPPASILGFMSSFFRKRAVINRLKALQSAGMTRRPWHAAVVAGLIGLVAIVGLTDASPPEQSFQPSADWLPSAAHDWDADGASRIGWGPSVTRTYNVEKVLKRIAVDVRTEADARKNMSTLLVLILRGSTGQFHATTNERALKMFTLDGAKLTVSAPVSVQTEISRSLNAWEQSGLGQISVETRFITDDRDIASAIGVSWRYLEAFSSDFEADLPAQNDVGMPVVRAQASVDEYFPIAVAILTEQQASALVHAAQADKQSISLFAPKVTVFNGQSALIQDRTRRPFVVGIQDGSAGIQKPKIALIDEGVELTLRATQSSDAKKVQLEGRIALSEIRDVRTVSTLLRGEPATIQIPRINRRRIDVSSEVPDGESLLIGCIPTYEQKKFFYVLLTVRSLHPQEETR